MKTQLSLISAKSPVVWARTRSWTSRALCNGAHNCRLEMLLSSAHLTAYGTWGEGVALWICLQELPEIYELFISWVLESISLKWNVSASQRLYSSKMSVSEREYQARMYKAAPSTGGRLSPWVTNQGGCWDAQSITGSCHYGGFPIITREGTGCGCRTKGTNQVSSLLTSVPRTRRCHAGFWGRMLLLFNFYF